MKKGTFRLVSFSIERTGYGQYVIRANYHGVDVDAHCSDSQVWDWIDDDSDKIKHDMARRKCYELIRRAAS